MIWRAAAAEKARWYRDFVRDNDLAITHTLIDPQTDRSKDAAPDETVRIVERRWNSVQEQDERGALRWVSAVVDAVCDAHAASGLDALNQAVDSGADARQLARQIVEHLRAVMLIKLGDPTLVDLPAEQRYDAALRLLGVDPAQLSGQVGHA